MICQADENLSHLDGIVSAALAAGAVGYSPPAEADGDTDDEEESGGMGGGGASFNLTPYARPSQVGRERTPPGGVGMTKPPCTPVTIKKIEVPGIYTSITGLLADFIIFCFFRGSSRAVR